MHRLAAITAWADRRGQSRVNAAAFLAGNQPANFRWEDVQQLVRHGMPSNRQTICRAVREGSSASSGRMREPARELPRGSHAMRALCGVRPVRA